MGLAGGSYRRRVAAAHNLRAHGEVLGLGQLLLLRLRPGRFLTVPPEIQVALFSEATVVAISAVQMRAAGKDAPLPTHRPGSARRINFIVGCGPSVAGWSDVGTSLSIIPGILCEAAATFCSARTHPA